MATLNNDFQLIGRGTSKQYGYATGYLELYAKLNSQSVENNNSNVTVEVRLVVSGGYIGNYQSTYWGIGGDLTASGDLGSGDYRSRTLGSATGNIPHSEDGTKSVSFTGSFNPTAWGTTLDVSGSADLPRIPRKANLTNAENFNDEGNPKITYSNPAGNSATTLQARIESTNGQTVYAAYRDVPKTENNYTFPLTTDERNALRNATRTSNKMNVVFRLRTTIGSYSDSETLQREMTIINANPTFTNFTYKATPTTLTGSDQIIIVGYSNVEAIISNANKAVANKGANMTQNGAKYQFAITGNSTIDIAYSSSSEVNGTINKAASGSLTVYAIDSRKNSKAVSKTISGNNLKNYSNIYLNASNSTLTRDQSGIGGNVTLHYEGTIWNNSFGSVTNSVVSVSYQYKKTTASNYTPGTTTITPTLSGNNLSFTGIIAGDGTAGVFDISSSYDIKITITDKLSSYTINLLLGSGTPNIAYADDGVAIMGDYDENVKGSLQVKGDGDNIITLLNSKTSTDTMLETNASWNNRQLKFGIGSGGVNRGIYDGYLNRWLFYADDSKLYANGHLISTTINSKLETINGRITNANVSHTYENNKAHMQLLLATSAMTSNKPIADGYIMHYSWDNASAYDSQFYLPNNNVNQPLQFRGCNNGTWGSWENINREKLIYDNSTGTAGTVSLTETTANFRKIKIYYYFVSNSTKYYNSVEIHDPNSKKFTITISKPSSLLIASQTRSVSGTSITNDYSGTYNSWGNPTATDEIKIYRVYGVR